MRIRGVLYVIHVYELRNPLIETNNIGKCMTFLNPKSNRSMNELRSDAAQNTGLSRAG